LGNCHEEFWIIYLNNGTKVTFKILLSKGGITGTLVDVRIVLKQLEMELRL
jgi:DNA repair protein RadC